MNKKELSFLREIENDFSHRKVVQNFHYNLPYKPSVIEIISQVFLDIEDEINEIFNEIIHKRSYPKNKIYIESEEGKRQKSKEFFFKQASIYSPLHKKRRSNTDGQAIEETRKNIEEIFHAVEEKIKIFYGEDIALNEQEISSKEGVFILMLRDLKKIIHDYLRGAVSKKRAISKLTNKFRISIEKFLQDIVLGYSDRTNEILYGVKKSAHAVINISDYITSIHNENNLTKEKVLQILSEHSWRMEFEKKILDPGKAFEYIFLDTGIRYKELFQSGNNKVHLIFNKVCGKQDKEKKIDGIGIYVFNTEESGQAHSVRFGIQLTTMKCLPEKVLKEEGGVHFSEKDPVSNFQSYNTIAEKRKKDFYKKFHSVSGANETMNLFQDEEEYPRRLVSDTHILIYINSHIHKYFSQNRYYSSGIDQKNIDAGKKVFHDWEENGFSSQGPIQYLPQVVREETFSVHSIFYNTVTDLVNRFLLDWKLQKISLSSIREFERNKGVNKKKQLWEYISFEEKEFQFSEEIHGKKFTMKYTFLSRGKQCPIFRIEAYTETGAMLIFWEVFINSAFVYKMYCAKKDKKYKSTKTNS